MKHANVYFFLLGIFIFPLNSAKELPRVFIFTDINIDSGDPDDRQSLIHLFWYANELKIEGIVPDRWNAKGYEACELVVDAYAKDYESFNFDEKGYPGPSGLKDLIATDTKDAIGKFQEAASDSTSPLYVLIWGNMRVFNEVLFKDPGLAATIRVLTIGTGLMLETSFPYRPDNWEKLPPCKQMNWNGPGRNDIYTDERFNEMWWLEMNWTYEGMFSGDEPKEMFEKLSHYGNMGQHIKEVVKNESWAQYFRVGDTPTVLYMIDPQNDLNDPTKESWAGKFVSPFPGQKPNYFTDYNGTVDWDYGNPCNSWQNHEEMRDVAKGTLEERRPGMYSELVTKLNGLYSTK